jgi:hypothetical protein
MADPYVPAGARQAATQATQLRAQYTQAVAAIRKDKTTSQAQKRTEVDTLRGRYTPRMAELRSQWNGAMQAAQAAAVTTLLRPPVAGRFINDSFHGHRRTLRDASLATLVEEFDWAEVAGDSVLMKVCAALAFQRITPLPGDAATRLVERYVSQRLDDGSRLDPDAADGYQRWLDLRRTPEQHLGDTATFSVSDRPEATTEPGPPPSPRQQAADKIAELFPTGPDAPTSQG